MRVLEIADGVKAIDGMLVGSTHSLSTYLIEGERKAVIDPGPTSQAVRVIDILNQRNVKPELSMATHIHLDHAGGSWKLAEEYACQIYCHPRGASHMVDPSKLKAAAKKLFGERLLNYGEVTGVPASKIRESFDGELLDFGGIVLEVLWIPGHSSHSQSFWEPDSKTVFVGDAVGHTMGDGGPVVPVSPPPHNPLRAVQSIDKIIGLGPETLCIAHNGPHHDAVTHLKRIKERSIHWGELAVRGAKEEMSLEGFSSFVLEEDEKLSHHIKDLPSPMTELGANLLGFWLYGKWKLDQG